MSPNFQRIKRLYHHPDYSDLGGASDFLKQICHTARPIRSTLTRWNLLYCLVFEDDGKCENINLNEDISKFHIILTLRFIPFKAANPSSTNWPAPNVWGEVFVAQLVEHC